MRVSFYAPLKSPEHRVPSGDRRIARLLIEALQASQCEVSLASTFRSYDKHGDDERQRRLESIANKQSERFIRRVRRGAVKSPDVWLTYHLYHKAPDWIGPRVSGVLQIPYVVVEASHAPKQASGRWRRGYCAAQAAIEHASRIVCLNPADVPALERLLGSQHRAIELLAPFLRLDDFPSSGHLRDESSHRCRLVTVAMMRDDVKVQSYRVLADALEQLVDLPWELHIVGTGVAEAAVAAAMSRFDPPRIHWHGQLNQEQVIQVLAHADVFAWPAVGEAFGMSLLEAQACGLPVAAAQRPGVAAIVADGETGLLSEEGDASDFARSLRCLISSPAMRRRLGRAARQKVEAEHDISTAGAQLKRVLADAIEGMPCTS